MFNVYEGIDLKASKFITIYIKPVSKIGFRAMWTSTFPKRLRRSLGTKSVRG
jgi:hypothetical protein